MGFIKFLSKMGKYKIIQIRNECISCGACAAACPKFWEMAEDGKALPKGGKKKGDNYELEIEEKDLACNKEAEEVCPVQIIKIEKK